MLARTPRASRLLGGLAFTLAFALSAPSPGQSLADLMPEGALLHVQVAGRAEAGAILEKARVGTILKELGPFWGEVWAGLEAPRKQFEGEFEKNVGMSVWDALAAFEGGVEIGVMNFDPEIGAPNVALRIGTAGREAQVRAVIDALAKMMGGPDGPAAGPSFDHQGVSVRTFGEPPLHFAEAKGSLFVTLFPDDMRGILDRLAGGGGAAAAPLAKGARYMKARATTVGDQAPLFVYADLGKLVETLALPQLGNDERHVLDVLGATDIQTLSFGVSLHGEGLTTRLHLGAPTTERKGVLGVMQHGACDKTLAALAPSTVVSSFACKFDPNLFFERGLALAAEVEPRAKTEVESVLTDVEKEYGVNLRQDLLAPFGGDWGMFSFAPRHGGLPLTVAVHRPKDAAGFVAAQEKLAKALGTELKTREMAGRTYTYMQSRVGTLGEEPFRELDRDPVAAAAFFTATTFGQAWTIEDGVLYAADMPHTLADYFEAYADGGALLNADFAQLYEQFPADAQFVSYSDPRYYFTGMYDIGIRVGKIFEGFGREAGVSLDFNTLPRAQAIAKHLGPGLAALTLDNDGLTLHSEATLGGLDAVTIGVGVGAIVAAIAIPNLIEAKKSANETMAIASLRTLVTCQMLFRDADKDGDGEFNFAGSLEELAEYDLLDPVLGTGVKQGYFFQMTVGPDGSTFTAEAHPVSPDETGIRYFFVDESGVIRYEIFEPANAESYPIGR